MTQPQQSHVSNPMGMDHCQTPPEAVDLMVQFLKQAGFTVHATDLRHGQDFFTFRPDFDFDMVLTNPPFSVAHKFIAQANWYKKPWSMLMKSERAGVAGYRDGLFVRRDDGLLVSDYEQVIPDGRISFKMPFKGWGKDGKGQAHFHTSWYCR